jgi:hypothetical protein
MGAAAVVAAVIALELLVMGRAVWPLVAALVIAFGIWRAGVAAAGSRSVRAAAIVAIVVQVLHLVEERQTGFYREFPPLFGAEPWTAQRFVTFNVAWLVAFVIATAMTERTKLASLALLFLVVGGGIGNGLGHLGLALRAGGYFPGLYTAPFAFAAGTNLLWRLTRRGIASGPA